MELSMAGLSATAQRTRVGLIVVLGLGFVLASGRATAQFQQYVSPGEFEEVRESMEERLDRAMKASRWRLGRTFVDPWLGLRNIAYIDNVRGAANTPSDFTASLGAGIRLYRPIGTEMTFAAHALPEYVWWQDLTERRRTNGRYGAGFFGNLGRTGLELSATRADDAQFFSREVETPVNTRYDTGDAEFEVDIGAGISFFAAAEVRLIRYLDEDDPQLADLDLLDRDEEILRGGVRFSPTRSLTIGLGVEESTVDFRAAVRDRSNSGTAPILQLEFQGSRFDFASNLAQRKLEPEPGSDFIPFEETTGSVRLEGTFSGRLKPQLYANKNLVYSITQRWAYLEDYAVGLGIHTSLGRLASVRFFVEQGTNDYTALETGQIDRTDDLDVVGAELRLSFGRYSLRIGTTRTQYDSNLNEFDREVSVFRTGIGLGTGGGSPWG